MKGQKRGRYSTHKDNSHQQSQNHSSVFCANAQCSAGNHDCDLWTECPMFKGGEVAANEQKPSKYRSEKVEILGIRFDSKREARRWFELTTLEKAGEIKNLRRQVKFELIPTQSEPDITGKRGGIKHGRVLENEVSYYADFVYEDRDGQTVVEDTKGVRTPEYIIKRKLLLWRYGIKIQEI